MRTPLVVGNWKMNGTLAESRVLAGALREGLKRPRGVEVVVCPPFTALPAVAEILGLGPIMLGGQNCHHEASGAHTGEISPPMLVELGCRFVILGHSERRREMGETDEQINRKVGGVLQHGLTPILCVGETAEERRQGLTFTTVEGQLRAGLAGLDGDAGRQVRARLRADLGDRHRRQRHAGPGRRGARLSARACSRRSPPRRSRRPIRILYGGSVKADNADALLAETEIDGALVGGASLTGPGFIAIVRKAARGAASRGD